MGVKDRALKLYLEVELEFQFHCWEAPYGSFVIILLLF